MSDSLWGVALVWQAYLEEATAGLRGNAMARGVREELRAHLEEARQRLMAEEGLDAEETAREAVRRMGSPQSLGAALRARHSVDWPRLFRAGALAGGAGAAVFAIGLHLLWRVVLFVTTIGDRAVLWGLPVPPSAGLDLAYAHALSALLVSLVWTASALAPLAAALMWVPRGSGRRPVEGAVAVMAGLTFAIALAAMERGMGALGLVHDVWQPAYGGGFSGLVVNPFLSAVYGHPPLTFVAMGRYGPLSLSDVGLFAQWYLGAALIIAGFAYAARRLRPRQPTHASVM